MLYIDHCEGQMSKASIDYINARRNAKAASGGAKQSRECRQCPDSELDSHTVVVYRAETTIFDFAIWAEASRVQYLQANGTREAETYDEIPF